MKYVFLAILLLAVLSGCLEITEKDDNGMDENADTPPFDINRFLGIDGNIDSNQSTDLNATQDQNVLDLPDELREDYCRGLENQTKIDSCINDVAVAHLDTTLCSTLRVLDSDNCIFNVAKKTQKLGDCLSITKLFLKNHCLNTVGRQSGDISFCSVISNDEELKKSCFAAVDDSLIGGTCDEISDKSLRESCYFDNASSQDNYNLCALITGSIVQREYLRDNCLDVFYDSFTDPKVCNLYFNRDKKIDCFFDIGIKNDNVDTCKEVELDYNSSICIKTVAIQKEEQTDCYEILDGEILQECLEYFAQTSPTLEYCEGIEDKAIREECYKEVGIALLDDSICDKIIGRSSKIRSTCYLEIVKQTNELSTCQKMFPTHFDIKDECILSVVQNNLDFSLCEEIHFGDNYVLCFSTIAISVDNFGICNQMEKDYFVDLEFNPKFGCYKEFAVGKGDSVACELITSTSIRDECLLEVIACTTYMCSGTPEVCEYVPITTCTNDDGCCPLNCSLQDDNDCEESGLCADVECTSDRKCVYGDCVLKNCAERNGNLCASNQTCPGATYITSDAGICCAETCEDIPCDGACVEGEECIDEQCIPIICSDRGGVSCQNAESCDSWLTAFDTKNCCLSTCQKTTTTPGTYLECQEITDASYTGNLTSTQWFTIQPASGGAAFGKITDSGWESSSPNFTSLQQISVIPLDNSAVTNYYDSGIITITCYGGSKQIYIPNFTDIDEDGFIDEQGIFFDTGFYVGNNGTTYYDPELTVIARQG